MSETQNRPPGRSTRNISTKQGEQQGAGGAARRSLDALGKAPALAKLDRQSRHQDGGGGEFDHAVQSKRRQHETAGGETGDERSLDRHPADRQPFEPERFTDEAIALGKKRHLRRQGQRRRPAARIRVGLRGLVDPLLAQARSSLAQNAKTRDGVGPAACPGRSSRTENAGTLYIS